MAGSFHPSTRSNRSTLSVGVIVLTALVFGTIAVLLSPAVSGNAAAGPPPDPFSLLECDERSLTENGEVAYVMSSSPLYPAEFRSNATPEQVANRLIQAHSLTSARPAISEVFRSAEQIDYATHAADGRIIAVFTVINQDGWREGDSVACANGYRPPAE